MKYYIKTVIFKGYIDFIDLIYFSYENHQNFINLNNVLYAPRIFIFEFLKLNGLYT